MPYVASHPDLFAKWVRVSSRHNRYFVQLGFKVLTGWAEGWLWDNFSSMQTAECTSAFVVVLDIPPTLCWVLLKCFILHAKLLSWPALLHKLLMFIVLVVRRRTCGRVLIPAAVVAPSPPPLLLELCSTQICGLGLTSNAVLLRVNQFRSWIPFYHLVVPFTVHIWAE